MDIEIVVVGVISLRVFMVFFLVVVLGCVFFCGDVVGVVVVGY